MTLPTPCQSPTYRPRLPGVRPSWNGSLGLVGTAITDGTEANETALRPRLYTEEEKISLAVTHVAENKKLLEALAWRLGIPVADIRPDGREPPLAREVDGASTAEKEGTGRGYEDDEEIDGNREVIEVRDEVFRPPWQGGALSARKILRCITGLPKTPCLTFKSQAV